MTNVRSMLLLGTAMFMLAAGPAAFAGSSACDAVAGNLVQNCGFETGSFSGWNNYASNYTAVDASNPYSGTYAASLGSESIALLTQTVTDVTGAYYDLSFQMENEVAVDATGTLYPGTNTFEVDYTNAAGNSFTLGEFTNIAESATFTHYSFNFFGSGTDTLVFIYDNVPSYFVLDDVTLVDPPPPGSAELSTIASATPEPSGLVLLGTGVMALAGLARRSLKTSAGAL
jgi:hypothetical protein